MRSNAIDEILADRPYGFWPMGYKDSDGSAYDLSRHGRSGAMDSDVTPYPAPGGLRRASKVGGTNKLTVSATNLPDYSASFSFSLWLRGVYSTTNDTAQIVGSQGVLGFFLYWNRPTTGRMTCYFGQGNESEALLSSGSPRWNDGLWHQWTWVRDTRVSPVRLSLFADGRLDATRTETGSAPPGARTTMAGDVPAGGDGTRLALVAAYDYALSPARILAQYRAGIGTRQRSTRHGRRLVRT